MKLDVYVNKTLAGALEQVDLTRYVFSYAHGADDAAMVSMSVYAPVAKDGDALDEPAMSLDGVRRWPTDKTLKYLAARCMQSAAKQASVKERLTSAMVKTAQDIAAMATERPSFEPVAKRMLELWSCGLALHSQSDTQKIRDLADAIDNEDAAYEQRPRQRL